MNSRVGDKNGDQNGDGTGETEPPGGAAAFRRSLLDWFREEGRDYPWRRTRDPYAILVSEAMLQQTQIATVLGRGYYERWMRAFPGWRELAAAPEQEILRAWEGLGYYNRARHLQRTASIVVTEHGGRFPEDPGTVRSLPGVGRYTTGAVLSLAFDLPLAAVDGNVIRVLSRIFACPVPVDRPSGVRLAWERAGALVPAEAPGQFNSALMELGQRFCRPAAPDCPGCPVRGHCLALAREETALYPVKERPRTVERVDEHVVLAARNGAVWLRHETGPRRRGLWRLPEVPAGAAADLEELFHFKYPITRFRVTLRVHAADASWNPPAEGDETGGWFPLAEPGAWPPLGAPYRKALLRAGAIPPVSGPEPPARGGRHGGIFSPDPACHGEKSF